MTGPTRILVVDDNQDAASTLCKLLEIRGYAARSVIESSKAVEAAKSFRPQVILVDVAMPRQDGYVTTRLLKQERELHDPYIVAMSGYCRESDRQAALDAGAHDFLAKPFGLEQIKGVLSAAFSRAIGC